MCPDQGAARGHFDLWSRSNGPLLGKGRQIKKFQASTIEDSGEEEIEAWDHTGLVSGFEGPRVKRSGILGSLV